jgi:uncharacterized protein (DUF1810 family)
MNDPYKLDRFVKAQETIYADVCEELHQGRKRSHWMWFVFPQIKGLGYSSTSKIFAISSLDEAKAYLSHPVLGPRLIECTELVNKTSGRTAHEIFGSPDDMKFHSSMTLFSQAEPENPVFKNALVKFFGGQEDQMTLDRL